MQATESDFWREASLADPRLGQLPFPILESQQIGIGLPLAGGSISDTHHEKQRITADDAQETVLHGHWVVRKTYDIEVRKYCSPHMKDLVVEFAKTCCAYQLL